MLLWTTAEQSQTPAQQTVHVPHFSCAICFDTGQHEGELGSRQAD